jgi:hypothetical protein
MQIVIRREVAKNEDLKIYAVDHAIYIVGTIVYVAP